MAGKINTLKFFSLVAVAACFFTVLSGCGLSQVPKKNKLKSNLHYNLGINDYQNENYIKSIQEFMKAKALNPYSARNYNGIGMVYMVTNRESKAIRNFKNAVRINPEFSDAYYNMAIIYIKEKDFNLAKNMLKKALKNPFYNSPYESYSQLAKIYLLENKLKKAKKILIISYLLDKKYFLTYYYLGKYYLIKKKLNKSLYNFKKALYFDNFFTPAKYYEGVVFFKQKKYEKAKKIFSYVYNIDKTSKYGIKSIDYIKKIMILYSKN